MLRPLLPLLELLAKSCPSSVLRRSPSRPLSPTPLCPGPFVISICCARLRLPLFPEDRKMCKSVYQSINTIMPPFPLICLLLSSSQLANFSTTTYSEQCTRKNMIVCVVRDTDSWWCRCSVIRLQVQFVRGAREAIYENAPLDLYLVGYMASIVL